MGGTIKYKRELNAWEKAFRRAAQKDDFALLRGLLRKFELADEPEHLLEGTIDFVGMCVAYATMDGRSPVGLIELQKYQPAEVGDATYVLLFDFYGKGYARVATGPRFGLLDFADLYDVPWDRYQVVGYSAILISRIDGAALSAEEQQSIEQEITEDLRFDYGEDELSFWFDPDTYEGALAMSIQDVIADDALKERDDP